MRAVLFQVCFAESAQHLRIILTTSLLSLPLLPLLPVLRRQDGSGRLETLVGEYLDHLHYLNDVFRLGVARLNDTLSRLLMESLLIPLFVFSLAPGTPEAGKPQVRVLVNQPTNQQQKKNQPTNQPTNKPTKGGKVTSP